MDSTEIINALREKHAANRGWIFFGELRGGTGYGFNKEQRIDAWAIQCWEMAISEDGKRINIPNLRIAYEVKISRSDFIAEMRNPDKRAFAYSVSHQFYFVAVPGIIDIKELDQFDGLMLFENGKLTVAKKAFIRPNQFPRWSFVASICRRVVDIDN